MGDPSGAMSASEQLAAAVRQATDDLAGYARGLTPQQWRTPAANNPDIVRGEDEHRLAGVVVHHVAIGFPFLLSRVRLRVETGDAPPLMPQAFDAANEAHARQNPDPDQAETIAMLERGGASTAEYVETLTGEQLDRGSQSGMSAGDFVRRVLVGHVYEHLGSLKATFPA